MTARTAWVFLAATAVVELASTIGFLAAAGYSPSTVNDPARLVAVGDGGADLLRVASQLDMLGYLLAVPLAFYLRARFLGEAGIDLFTLAGIVALVLGALGAMAFAYGGVPLIHEYGSASETGKQAIATTFATVHRIVIFGLWQTLDAGLAGVWLLGTGRLAWRRGVRPLGAVLIAFGTIGAAAAIAHISGIYPGS